MKGCKRDRARPALLIVQCAVLAILTMMLATACSMTPSVPPTADPTASSAVSESGSAEPRSEEECEQAGGRWQQLGMIGMGCNLPTTDGGQPCGTLQDCQGLCLPSDPRTMKEVESGVQIPDTEYIQQVNESGRDIEGICSEWRSTFGCNVIVESGKYEEICID